MLLEVKGWQMNPPGYMKHDSCGPHLQWLSLSVGGGLNEKVVLFGIVGVGDGDNMVEVDPMFDGTVEVVLDGTVDADDVAAEEEDMFG